MIPSFSAASIRRLYFVYFCSPYERERERDGDVPNDDALNLRLILPLLLPAVGDTMGIPLRGGVSICLEHCTETPLPANFFCLPFLFVLLRRRGLNCCEGGEARI